ncbi:MAG TPA: hypothetical protein VM265_04145 [Sphingomicrobium sp.]|nr:hypothetical protein [Sphingomicrobium sp.]
MMRSTATLCAIAAVAGCASPSTRIAAELSRYGLDEPRAQCVGQRLERDLSMTQLRELAAAARAYGTNDTTPGRLTLSDFTRVAGSMRDPKVPVAVLRAGSACGVTVLDVLG